MPSSSGMPDPGVVPGLGVVDVPGVDVSGVVVSGAATDCPAPPTIAASTAITNSPNSLIRLISNFCTMPV